MTRTFMKFAGVVGLLGSVSAAAWSCAGTGSSDSGDDGGGSGSGADARSGSGSGGGSGSGSGSGGSGAVGDSGSDSTTGGGSGGGSGSGSGGGADGATGSCIVTSTGGIPMTGTAGNYLQSPSGVTPSYAGYAYVLSDSTALGCGASADAKACGTSVGCLATGEFCGSGTTGVKNGAVTYGAGFGANLSEGTDGGVTAPVTVSGTGLTYAVSSAPPNSLEIAIKDENDNSYCALTTAATGTIPWGSFLEKCTSNPPGTAFAGTSVKAVSFTARAGAAASPYDFCVTSLSF